MTKPPKAPEVEIVRSRGAGRELAWDVWGILLCGPGLGLGLEVIDCLTYLLAWVFAGRDFYQWEDVWEIQSARSTQLWIGRMVLGVAIGVVFLFARAVLSRRIVLRVYVPVVLILTLVTFLLINLVLIQHDPYNVTVQWIASNVLAGLALITGVFCVVRVPKRRR